MSALRMQVRAMTWEAEGVLRLDLQALGGGPLPGYEPGAHVDLTLAPGLTRSYSLIDGNPGPAPELYRVGVGLEAGSRGGSRHVHQRLRPGDTLPASPPRCRFLLIEDSPFTQLIAGGIGITPLMAMAERLHALGRPWRLLWCVRSRARLPFRDWLARHAAQVDLHVDDEQGGPWGGWSALLLALPEGAHAYACGPAPMLAAYEAAAAGVLPPAQVHLERFAAAGPEPAVPQTDDSSFHVHLARSGQRILVRGDQTVLQALQAHLPDLPHACLQGVCGQCETRVLDGVPDHRDQVLTPSERASGQTMMPCCSRAASPELVLDL
jgi:vanillate O-demethylase ferredoxin subunit